MCFDDGFDGGYEPFEDDLQAFSDQQAWEDSRADMEEMATEDIQTATLSLSQEDAAEANRLLSLQGPVPDTKQDAVLLTFTARFQDGCEADIKVCNGGAPWLDVVLFNEDGCEIEVLDVGEGPIEKEYRFSGYTVIVEVA